jgi:hypothetical protein
MVMIAVVMERHMANGSKKRGRTASIKPAAKSAVAAVRRRVPTTGRRAVAIGVGKALLRKPRVIPGLLKLFRESRYADEIRRNCR